MSQQLLQLAEKACLKKEVPEFSVGNTVDVSVKIIEGSKERVQIFNGVVIARRGAGMNEMFIVRRIVNNEGVERTFVLHSPLVVDVKVRRRGKVRRAKLYYLRDRVGKSRRLREQRVSSTKTKRGAEKTVAAPEPPAEELATAGV
ncbi:MAG: 50S ribosomal protein L19 [bacterium]|nr:50S ribosomal protein L19 [bacterium]